VLTVVEEMQKAMVNDPRVATWNWAHEKHRIRGLCLSWIAKHPELSICLPDDLRVKFDHHRRDGRRPFFKFDNRDGWHVRRGELDPRLQPEQPLKAEEHTPSSSVGDAPDAPKTEGNGRKYRFKLVKFADLRPGVEPLYLVDELIPVAGLVDVWGKAKCYKSFWTLDLMLHVAMGWEYRDRYVHQGAVVYCAFEGAHGYKKRVEALRRHYHIEAAVPLYVMPGQANPHHRAPPPD
jgi:hypothetical protein